MEVGDAAVDAAVVDLISVDGAVVPVDDVDALTPLLVMVDPLRIGSEATVTLCTLYTVGSVVAAVVAGHVYKVTGGRVIDKVVEMTLSFVVVLTTVERFTMVLVIVERLVLILVLVTVEKPVVVTVEVLVEVLVEVEVTVGMASRIQLHADETAAGF